MKFSEFNLQNTFITMSLFIFYVPVCAGKVGNDTEEENNDTPPTK
jgi:hypothetical protein